MRYTWFISWRVVCSHTETLHLTLFCFRTDVWRAIQQRMLLLTTTHTFYLYFVFLNETSLVVSLYNLKTASV